MHLITALAAGINGAPSGTATLAKRGTSTQATWYSSFEGDGASTATVTLDGNGGASVYVNELVTVTVKDSSGATVRTFTAGAAAPAVEVQSTSFTGTNYEDASSAAGEPTTMQAVLDKWLTSAGAIDFNVLIDSTATTLQDFAGFASGLIFNVQSPAYAATGDGSADDSSAVQAAIDAAEAAGGGVVYFPKGTYYLDGDLVFADNVTLLGASRELAVLNFNTYELDVQGASGKVLTLQNLTLTNATHGDGELIKVTGAQGVRVSNCTFGDASAGAWNAVGRLDDGDATFQDCTFYYFEHATYTRAGATGGVYRFMDCKFVAVETAVVTDIPAIELVGSVDLYTRNCEWDVTAVTTATTAAAVRVANTTFTGGVRMFASELSAKGSGMDVHFVFRAPDSTSYGPLVIDGLCIGDGTETLTDYEENAIDVGSTAPTYARIVGCGSLIYTSNDTEVWPTGVHDTIFVTRTNSTALTIAINSSHTGVVGQECNIVVLGGTGNTAVTVSDADFDRTNTSALSVTAGDTAVFKFVKISGTQWAQVGTAAVGT